MKLEFIVILRFKTNKSRVHGDVEKHHFRDLIGDLSGHHRPKQQNHPDIVRIQDLDCPDIICYVVSVAKAKIVQRNNFDTIIVKLSKVVTSRSKHKLSQIYVFGPR